MPSYRQAMSGRSAPASAGFPAVGAFFRLPIPPPMCFSIDASDRPRESSNAPARSPSRIDPMAKFYGFTAAGRRLLPNHWDLIALAVILAVLAAIARAYHGISAPLPPANEPAVSLDYCELPYYALRTTLRMFAALVASLVFTFTYATLAAKSRRAEMVLIPVLDILQSVPILGFLSFTVTFFLGLFPGNVLGAECAAIFAIFTSQAWNMAFSLLPVAAHGAARSRRGGARLPPHRLAEILAAGGALRHARPDLEHDDVDVGRLVLRRRLRSDHGRRHDDHPAGRRLLHRRGQRRGRLGRDRRRGRDDGDRHPALRSVAVPPDHRLGGEIPRRAVGGQRGRALLGARPPAAHALDPAWRSGRSSRRCARSSFWRDRLARLAARQGARADDRQPSRILDVALDRLRRRRSRSWALWSVVAFVAHGTRLGRRRRSVDAHLLHAAARRRAHGAGDARLGADQRLDRPAAALGRGGPAGRAIPRGLSGQSAFRRRGQPRADVPPQSRHLAELPDRLRHAMVHRVQHDRRRGGVSQRSARGGGELSRPRLGLVAAR